MTPEQLQIVFLGIEAICVLFGFYALYEWGRHLVGRIKAGGMAVNKAQLLFSIPAAVLSLVPFVLVVLAMRLQPFGEVTLFDMNDANTLFAMFGSLLAGMVLQGIAAGIFWFFTRKL